MIETLLGKLMLGVLAIAVTAGLGYWRGHRAAEAHAKTVVDACIQGRNAAQADNRAKAAAIAKLQAVNQRFADTAAAGQTAAHAAETTVASDDAASGAALAHTQTQLTEAIHATANAHAWGDTRVPAAVARELRQPTAAD